MPIPPNSGKTTLEKLGGVKRFGLSEGEAFPVEQSCLFSSEHEGFKFDFLWHPKENQKRLFVLFSGDAIRKTNNPPVFQRWSWASYFPGHCLFVSDPSLYLDERLGLAWYCGTEQYDPMPEITRVIRRICVQFQIDEGRVCSYGSSGGGYAALRMGAFMPESTAIAVNPQIVVTNYAMKSADFYLNLCFNGRSRDAAIKDFPDRLNLLSHVERLKRQKLIYIQNSVDIHHFADHFSPFCEAMGVAPNGNESVGNFRRIIFSHAGGHKKAETQEAFDAAMKIVSHW